MSFCNNCLKYSLRLTAVALAALLAGCSLNPFANDDAPSYEAPAASSTPARSSSSSMNSGSSSVSSSQPVLQRIGDAVPLAAGHPNEYVVQVGDTLWDIAGRFLNDPWYWPEIWYVNPEIENPHLIYPGDVLGIIMVDGVPRITNIRSSTYRLSPQARVTPLSEAVNSIPYEAVAAFLSTGVVMEKDQVDAMPYIASTANEHLVAAAGDRVYIRGATNASPGGRYNVVHVGDELIDPDDDHVVGFHGLLVGTGTLRSNGDPGTFALTDTTRENRIGDRLIPESVDVPLNFFPTTPSTNIDGRIMAVVGGVTQIGQYQVVVINRGTNHGLNTGDVLTVFQSGQTVKDRFAGGSFVLPDEEAGTMMIFKTYDRISYGLVMEATLAIHVLDAVRNPI